MAKSDQGEAASSEDLAYCAGVVDSDGCIRIFKRLVREKAKGKLKGKAPYLNYAELIQVGQVEPEAIELLKKIFGGYVYLRKRKSKKHRDIYVWKVQQLATYQCILELRPYLRIKSEQADNCIQFREAFEECKKENRSIPGSVGSRPRSKASLVRLDSYYLTQKVLNSGVK
jgi:hypothetical protein